MGVVSFPVAFGGLFRVTGGHPCTLHHLTGWITIRKPLIPFTHHKCMCNVLAGENYSTLVFELSSSMS
jgi:hypothetical protein